MQDKHVSDILDFINNNDNFLLTSHINADGDAIASVLACSLFLDELHKKYLILLHDHEIDSKYRYLKNWEKIQPFQKEQINNYRTQINAAIIFDAPGKRRIGDVAELFSGEIKAVKIDHHPSDEKFGSLDWVDENASSASAMFYEVVAQSSVTLNIDLADVIYTGIIYDTGRLSFSNTRARDFEICAHLVECGVNPGKITNNLFFENKPNALQIMGIALQGLKQYNEDKITILHLDNEHLRNINQSETEELANYSVSLSGTEVGVYIREIQPQVFKISLRSKNNVDVSKVARQFDGGGHIKASGCRFEGNYDNLVTQIVKEISKQL